MQLSRQRNPGGRTTASPSNFDSFLLEQSTNPSDQPAVLTVDRAQSFAPNNLVDLGFSSNEERIEGLIPQPPPPDLTTTNWSYYDFDPGSFGGETWIRSLQGEPGGGNDFVASQSALQPGPSRHPNPSTAVIYDAFTLAEPWSNTHWPVAAQTPFCQPAWPPLGPVERPIQQFQQPTVFPPAVAPPQPATQRAHFLVKSGDARRIVIRCNRGDIPMIAVFKLDKKEGVIDRATVRSLQLTTRPQLPPRRTKPAAGRRKYAEMRIVDMEQIPGSQGLSASKLIPLDIDQYSESPLILGRAAARALGLEVMPHGLNG